MHYWYRVFHPVKLLIAFAIEFAKLVILELRWVAAVAITTTATKLIKEHTLEFIVAVEHNKLVALADIIINFR